MKIHKILIIILIFTLLLCGCDYIVLPEEEDSTSKESRGWSALITNIGESEEGKLHIDLTITNLTNEWSVMQAVEDQPAVLTTGGESIECPTVFVGTGGHRLAPGFQIRGYTVGTKTKPETQLIYVECEDVEVAQGASLAMDIIYFSGEYNYYFQEENKTEARLEINMDTIVTELTYPIAEPVEGLVQKSDIQIPALNATTLTLEEIARDDKGLKLTWNVVNPGEYATNVHIGVTPVVCQDGVFYGKYKSPDIPTVPVAPQAGEASWDTEVVVPAEVSGCYIMLSVEEKKQRLFTNHVIDITDK